MKHYAIETTDLLQLHHFVARSLLTFSNKVSMFCLNIFSLLRSMGVCFTSIFLTGPGAPSGGQGQNLIMTGMMALWNVSASVKSFMQLSLCMYLGVMQHTTTPAAFMVLWIWLCRLSGIVSWMWTLLWLSPLCMRCCAC